MDEKLNKATVEDTIKATRARVEELLVETADAGANQHKILALALVEYHARKIREKAWQMGRELHLPEELLANIDGPEKGESYEGALEMAQRDLKTATLLLKLSSLMKGLSK